MKHCNCKQLGRTLTGGELVTTHGKECPCREAELIGLLMELTNGIAEWASEEDGVHGAVWDHCKRAMVLIGFPVPTGLKEV